MTNKARNTAGKFSPKSETPRKIRSVNLTDSAWHWLARIAEEAGMSRNDYLEAMAGQQPVMETVEATANPIMETVEATAEFDESIYAALVDAETAKKSAAIFGFTPDEALADAYFQIDMLTSNFDELEDRHEALKREYSLALPLMETVQADAELHKRQLEASDAIIRARNQEIAALNSRLAGKDEIIAEAQEQIARLESEIASAEKSATTGTELPEIGELQSQLSDLKQDSVPASDLTNKTKAICKLVKPWVSAKYVENLNAQIKKEMERK